MKNKKQLNEKIGMSLAHTLLAAAIVAVFAAPASAQILFGNNISENSVLWLYNPADNYNTTTNVWADNSDVGGNHATAFVGSDGTHTYIAPTLGTVTPGSGQFSGQTISTLNFASGDSTVRNYELLQAPSLNGGSAYGAGDGMTMFTVYQATGTASDSRVAGFGAKNNPFGNNSGGDNFLQANDGSLRFDNGNVTGSAIPTELFIRVSVWSAAGGNVNDYWYDGAGQFANISSSGGSNQIDPDHFYIGDTGYLSFDGFSVAEALVFNKALSAGEIHSVVIPEPSTLALLGLAALAGVMTMKRRRG